MSLDAAQLETHRAALTGHCMLGSAFNAEDAVQDTMVRAWRSLDRLDGRASLRTWLCRMATNACLDALSHRARRARPMDECAVGSVDDPLDARARTRWLEPIPDARALPVDADPFEPHRGSPEHTVGICGCASASPSTPAGRTPDDRSPRLVFPLFGLSSRLHSQQPHERAVFLNGVVVRRRLSAICDTEAIR